MSQKGAAHDGVMNDVLLLLLSVSSLTHSSATLSGALAAVDLHASMVCVTSYGKAASAKL